VHNQRQEIARLRAALDTATIDAPEERAPGDAAEGGAEHDAGVK
jgi:hypothetical protein